MLKLYDFRMPAVARYNELVKELGLFTGNENKDRMTMNAICQKLVHFQNSGLGLACDIRRRVRLSHAGLVPKEKDQREASYGRNRFRPDAADAKYSMVITRPIQMTKLYQGLLEFQKENVQREHQIKMNIEFEIQKLAKIDERMAESEVKEENSRRKNKGRRRPWY